MTPQNVFTKSSATHENVVIERTYKASPARVFAAWESIEARLRWSSYKDGWGAHARQPRQRILNEF